MDAIRLCASTPRGINQVLEEGWQLVPFLHNDRLAVTEILGVLSPIKMPSQVVPAMFSRYYIRGKTMFVARMYMLARAA